MRARTREIAGALPRRLLIKLSLAAITLLAASGGAMAYLSASGAGAGTGSTQITLANVTVTGATATQALLPTGTGTGDLNVTLNNGNSSRVHINSLKLDPTKGIGGFSANAVACALSFTTQTNGGSGWLIAGNGSLSVDLMNSVTMGTSALSTCQGQSFTVYLTAT